MKLKKALGLGLAALSGLSLASCGDSTSELTIFLYQESVIYDENMEVFQKANEYAGIELDGVLQKYDSDYDTLYNLKGKEANLVVNDQDTIEATALKDEIFVDLTDLINEHAPNLKAYFENNPTHKKWATASDGAIYGIPFYTDGETAKAWFVRKDWIQILGENNKFTGDYANLANLYKNGEVNVEALNAMDFTIEKYENLLTCMKANSKLLIPASADNIYPYFDRDSDFAISELAGLWGATAEYYLDSNNQVKYGAVQPEFRAAMVEIARWYSKGLIDSEILNNEIAEDKRETFFAADTGGSTHDWLGTTYSFNDDVYAGNLTENFELVCIAPPSRTLADGSYVKHEATARKLIGKVTAINSETDEEDQIKLIKWIDYFFTEEGHNELNYGIKDTHWEEKDGKKVYTDKILNDQNTALANLYNNGAQMQTPGVQTFEYEKAWLSDEAYNAMEMYKPYLNTVYDYNRLIFPNIKLTKDDYAIVNSARNQVINVYNEQINDWLKGTDKINDTTWNEFVEKMNDSGVKTIVDTIQKYVN